MNTPPRVALIIETSVIYGRRIVHGVSRYLRYHFPWSVFLEQHELGAQPPEWLFTEKWDGILSRPTDAKLAEQLRQTGAPIVDLNDLYNNLGLPWVGSNHAEIGKLAATHLLELGHHHFAFAGFSDELWAKQRLEGFRTTVEAKGFSVSVYESPWHGPQAQRWEKDLSDLVDWLRHQPQPLGVMTCNDVRGLHVLDACSRANILVPEEVAVVGVDNEEILCELTRTPLSSVNPDAEQIGYRAAELLDSLMSRRRLKFKRILVPPLGVITRRSSESLAIEDRIMNVAMRFIRDQAFTGCTVEDVLNHVRVSRSSLERRFQQYLNRSPHAEIQAVQLRRVKELLSGTNFTLEHIASLCGYEHPEYMSVVFKKTYGMTPGQHRKTHSHPGQSQKPPVEKLS